MITGVLLMGQHPPSELSELVDLCEELAYDEFWYADERFYREVYIGLTMAALRTRRTNLGTLVTDPYSRHPAMTAAAIATLAELAPGRVRLGIGAGGSGFQAMGIERTKPVAALREAVDLIRRLLKGGPASCAGKVIRFDNGALDFQTVPSVPIYIASGAPQVLRLAGEIADGVVIGSYAGNAGLTAGLRHIHEGASRAGRDPVTIDVIARVDLAIASTRQAAYEVVKPEINYGLWFGCDRLAEGFLDYDPAAPAWQLPPALLEQLAKRDWSLVGPTAYMVPDALVPERALAGTVDDVLQNALRIAKLGFTHIVIYPIAVPGDSLGGTFASQVRLFATEIMPAVRSALEAGRSPASVVGSGR